MSKQSKPTRLQIVTQQINSYRQQQGGNTAILISATKDYNQFAAIDSTGIELFELNKKYNFGLLSVANYRWVDFAQVNVDHFTVKSIFSFTKLNGERWVFTTTSAGKEIVRIITSQTHMPVHLEARPIWRKIFGFRTKHPAKMLAAGMAYLLIFIFFISVVNGGGATSDKPLTANSEPTSSAVSTTPKVDPVNSPDASTAALNTDSEKKKAEEEKKKQQADVLTFEKSVYDLEGTAKPIMDHYKKVWDAVGKGNATVFDAYDATTKAKDASEQLQRGFYSLDIPSGLPKKVKGLLEDAKSDISTAYYTKSEAFAEMLKYLDDSKPKYVQKFKDDTAMADQFVMSGVLKIMQAKEELGLDISKLTK